MARHTRRLFKEAARAVKAKRKRQDERQREDIRLERERLRTEGRTDELGPLATAATGMKESARIARVREARTAGIALQPSLELGKAALEGRKVALAEKVAEGQFILGKAAQETGEELGKARLQTERLAITGLGPRVTEQAAAGAKGLLPKVTEQEPAAQIPVDERAVPARRTVGQLVGQTARKTMLRGAASTELLPGGAAIEAGKRLLKPATGFGEEIRRGFIGDDTAKIRKRKRRKALEEALVE